MNAITSSAQVAPIVTEAVEACPACGAGGEIALSDCVDYVTGLPGRWNFSECSRCRSLWLNPRPRPDAAALLYPENYPFTRSTAEFRLPAHGLVASMKLSILAHSYDYVSLIHAGDSVCGKVLGRSGAYFPPIRRKAGHAVRFLPKMSGHPRLLDVGCGDGIFLTSMRELGWNVEGIEIDPVAARLARNRGLSVRTGAIETTELAREVYDAITLTHATEHLFAPGHAFASLASALKPGGILVSISPNPRGVLRRFFRNNWYELDPPRHLFLPSAAGYKTLLDQSVFEIKTWTSLRLFPWACKESLSIARTGAVGALSDSAPLQLAISFASALATFLPGAGEEVICHARKR